MCTGYENRICGFQAGAEQQPIGVVGQRSGQFAILIGWLCHAAVTRTVVAQSGTCPTDV